jgi:hypothetical protein
VPSAHRREALLIEICTIRLGLNSLADRDRLILIERYDPDRGLTDPDLAIAVDCDR